MPDNLNRRAMLSRIAGGASVFVVMLAVGIVGYTWIGDGRWTSGEALYMTVITLSTVGFGETLPVEQRSAGGFAETLRGYRTLLTDRVFLGAVLNQGFLYAALFAYLAGSTFVLQDIYGLSPQWYAAAFGLNSAGHMVAGSLAGRAAERWSILGTLALGVGVTGVGALGLLAAGLTAMPLWVVIVALFLLFSGVALSAAPATTLALAEYPHMAGTASSLLGMVRFGFGGVAAPFVGVAGALSILPLGIVTVVCVVLSAAAGLLLAPRRPDRARSTTPAPSERARV